MACTDSNVTADTVSVKYGSVCSGIEAATVAWRSLGWRAAFFAEIEAFPSAVLSHHYPDVENRGDIRRFSEWPAAALDVLVGGTPCQSFSVAGLRAGLDDPRGNLMLTYLAIAERYRPRWIVWENVPGIISDATDALTSFLDGLESLGYIVDVDILDAQFHGLAQRRRRVFVCAQHRDDLIQQRTNSSALTIAQCWLEILHGILADQLPQLEKAPDDSDLAFLTRDGVLRRMKLFDLDGEREGLDRLGLNLVAAMARYPQGHEPSDAGHGKCAKERMRGDRSMDSATGDPFILTAESLSNALAESYEVMRSFIKLTGTKTIAEAEIFTCSRAVLLIAKLIQALNPSSPPFWSAASSALIAVEAYTDYARSASSDLFTAVEWISAWRDFLQQAEPTSDALADIGIECFGEIFPLSESLSGNPAPSRDQRKDVAGTITASAGKRRPEDSAQLVAFGGNNTSGPIDIAAACNAHGGSGRMDFESETFIAHSFRAAGFDAREDGTERGTPLVPICFDSKASGRNGFGTGEIAPTLRAMGHKDSHSNAGGQIAVAFQERGRAEGRELEIGGDIAYALTAPNGGGRSQERSILTPVRRLTPRECARLQGFPDDYLDIIYRGKPAADGPKYKALGNSKAVPVVRWIGQRVQMVERISRERAS